MLTASPLLTDAFGRYAYGDTLNRLSAREREFADITSLRLASIGMDSDRRASFDRFINGRWARTENRVRVVPEIVIGSGYHAATYVAARVLSGHPAPTVLERSDRPGGVFAMTDHPSFWLNSRNRPGEPGFPGEGANLNHLPGAPVQVEMLGMDEYPDNAMMAFVVRATLAQYATVHSNVEVVDTDYSYDLSNSRYWQVSLADGEPYYARRVIDARGLGDPNAGDDVNGMSVVTFPQFMQRMDNPFPLRGLKRVAVIGDGNSARCVVESLLGIAPSPVLAMSGLDLVDAIDWYGSNLESQCERWRQNERGRYLRIGEYLRPGRDGARARLRVFNEQGIAVPLLDRAIANGRQYDFAVLATGFRRSNWPSLSRFEFRDIVYGRQTVGSQYQGTDFYQIGPAASIPFSDTEANAGIDEIGDNREAMFRLGWRTALLASQLETVTAPDI